MAFGCITLAWAVVAAWLTAWEWMERRRTGRGALRIGQLWDPAGEAVLLALLGGLWFASLGPGTWWLPFLLVGALREWPVRSALGAARIGRIVVAGVLLAWSLPS